MILSNNRKTKALNRLRGCAADLHLCCLHIPEGEGLSRRGHFRVYDKTGFIQASMSKIQGLFKDFLKSLQQIQGLKVNEKSDLSVKILLQKN